jgi:hypothetical protein
MQVLSKFLPYMGGRSWLWPVGYCIELVNASSVQFVTLGMGGRSWMWGVGYSIKLVCALLSCYLTWVVLNVEGKYTSLNQVL